MADKLFYSYNSPWNSTSLDYSRNFPNSIIFNPVNHKIVQNGIIYSGSGDVIFIEGNISNTAGTWTGISESITQYYDGLTIMYVPKVAGASTTTLNINNLGAITCYFSGNNKLTNQYSINTPILFTYYDNGWRRADYSNDSTGILIDTITGSTSYYLLSSNELSGNRYAYAHSGLKYNITDGGILYSTYFNGWLRGTANKSIYSDNSHISEFTYLSQIHTTSTNQSYYITFSNQSTNNEFTYSYIDTDLNYNPNTNTLTASKFRGNLEGNADTATNAIHSTNADNATNATNSINSTYSQYSTYTDYILQHNLSNNATSYLYVTMTNVSTNSYGHSYVDDQLLYDIRNNVLVSNLYGNVTGNLTGNATTSSSATQLSNSRTLWGQSFNGTADVFGTISNTYNILPYEYAENNVVTPKYNIGSLALEYNKVFAKEFKGIADKIVSSQANTTKLYITGVEAVNGEHKYDSNIYLMTTAGALHTNYLCVGNTTINDTYRVYVTNGVYAGGGFKGAGFIHNTNPSNDYILLAGGGTMALADLNLNHPHPFLPLVGGTMTGAIKRYYDTASNDPMIALTSNNLDVWLWRINHGSNASVSTSGVHGFGLKYIGTGSGNDNYLKLYADNQNSTQVVALCIDQEGKIGIGGNSNSNYNFYVNGSSGFNGQISSSVSQGTAPFIVTSTTVNTNLNADLLDGKHATELFTYFNNIGGQTTRITIGGTSIDCNIDADTLDGYHASHFANSSDLSNYVLKSGDTMSGALTIKTNSANTQLVLIGQDAYGTIKLQTKESNGHFRIFGVKGNSADLFVTNADGWNNEYLIAHAGNITNSNATIGTSLTTIASIAGIEIKAKIGSYASSTHSHFVISGTDTNGSNIISSTDNSGYIILGNSGATAGSYGDSSNQTPNYSGTFKVPYITVNAKGIVTGISQHTVTIPAVSHYITSLYIGAVDAKSNIALTNPYIKLFDNDTLRNQYQIIGGTGIEVKSDANGHLTIKNTAPDVNHNTHFTTHLYIGAASSASNAVTTNGNTYIKLYDDTTLRHQYKIVGSGATTVVSSADGTITISSTDTNTDTDTKVTQSQTTTSNWRPVVLGYQNSTKSAAALYSTVTNEVYTTNVLQYQPSTGRLSSTSIEAGGFFHTSSLSDNDVITCNGSYKGWSNASNANKLVGRDSSGDIYVRYINSNISDESATIGSVYIKNTTDNNIRRVSFAEFKSQLENIIEINKTLSLTADTWADTGISGTDINGNGTYAVQVYVHTGGTTPNFYYAYFSGIMAWYKDSVNGSNQTDEIILHSSSHALSGSRIYLRTVSPANALLKLQIACNKATTNATFYFKFRKLI